MSFTRIPILRHGLMIRHEDILSDDVFAARLVRVRGMMREKGVASLMVYSDTITSGPVSYLTNYSCYGWGRQAVVVLGLEAGPYLYTTEPSRNLPRVRRFTVCDLEKTGRLMAAACAKARELVGGGGAIGLVGSANLPIALAGEAEKELRGFPLQEFSGEFLRLMAAKDRAGLAAIRQALQKVEQAFSKTMAGADKFEDLWQLGADLDYRLRLQGCEDTNILLGSARHGRIRPGYPAPRSLARGDIVVAYISAQYARHWGAIGRTLVLGKATQELQASFQHIWELRAAIPELVQAGLTLAEVKAGILGAAARAGVKLADDLPLVEGVGLDLLEYPVSPGDLVEGGSILQVALAVDPERSGAGSTVILVDLLQVKENGGTWLGGEANLLEVGLN